MGLTPSLSFAADEISGVELNYTKDMSTPDHECPKRADEKRIRALAEQVFGSSANCFMDLLAHRGI